MRIYSCEPSVCVINFYQLSTAYGIVFDFKLVSLNLLSFADTVGTFATVNLSKRLTGRPIITKRALPRFKLFHVDDPA